MDRKGDKRKAASRLRIILLPLFPLQVDQSAICNLQSEIEEEYG
jgi:hypothetical protein